MSLVVRRIKRPDPRLVKSFSGLDVATIHESIGKEVPCTMDESIKPIGLGMKLLGPAVTVDCFPADNLSVHLAMTLCRRGDVLVVNGHGVPGVMWGGQMTYQAIQQRIAGVVVDGAVRDSEAIRKMRFPCFAKMVNPMGSAKRTLGSVNTPIQCGGVIVYPGDVVVGDDDGVVVVRRDLLGHVAKRARQRIGKERRDRRLLKDGVSSLQVYQLEKVVRESNVREIDTLEDLFSQSG